MLLTTLLFMATRIQPEAVTVPSRQPQLAARNDQVAMAFGAGNTIYFTSSPDQGRTFLPPIKVAEVGAMALGRHRGPRLSILKDALVISAMVGDKVTPAVQAHGSPESGNLRSWRSTDHGKTWTRAGVINDVSGSAREGLHAMTVDSKGNLVATWLDLRSEGTKLYEARSTDGGITWDKNALVYESPAGTICQCCAPSLASDAQGHIYAMWRNVIDGSRDMYIASAADGSKFGPAKKLGEGTWKLNACPMDGGGFAVEDGQVTSAWRRDGTVFLTEPGKAEKPLGAGKDVAVVRTKFGAFVAWTKDGAIQIMTPKATAPVQLTAEGAFVNLIALPDGSVVAAWEAHNSIETKRVE